MAQFFFKWPVNSIRFSFWILNVRYTGSDFLCAEHLQFSSTSSDSSDLHLFALKTLSKAFTDSQWIQWALDPARSITCRLLKSQLNCPLSPLFYFFSLVYLTKYTKLKKSAKNQSHSFFLPYQGLLVISSTVIFCFGIATIRLSDLFCLLHSFSLSIIHPFGFKQFLVLTSHRTYFLKLIL